MSWKCIDEEEDGKKLPMVIKITLMRPNFMCSGYAMPKMIHMFYHDNCKSGVSSTKYLLIEAIGRPKNNLLSPLFIYHVHIGMSVRKKK